MTKLTGRCLCGSIRYTSSEQPILTALCHCTHCQRQTSSAFSVVVAVSKGSLHVDGPSLSSYEDVGDSGEPVVRSFCNRCGSPIFSEVASMAELHFIKAGTLDDTSWLSPQMNIWCSTAQPWVEMSPDLPRFEKNPPLDGATEG